MLPLYLEKADLTLSMLSLQHIAAIEGPFPEILADNAPPSIAERIGS